MIELESLRIWHGWETNDGNGLYGKVCMMDRRWLMYELSKSRVEGGLMKNASISSENLVSLSNLSFVYGRRISLEI